MAGRILRPGAGPIYRGTQGIFLAGTGRIGGFDASLGKSTSAVYTTYYVDSVGGLDSNDGLTPATAWQTLAKAAGRIYSPYSIIALKGGQTITGTLDLSASVSAIVNPAYDLFKVTSYGVGRATIQPSSGQGIIIYDAPGGWTVNNVNVAFSGTAGQGIYLGTSSRRMRYCKITNCDVTGAFNGGGGAIVIADDVGTTGAIGIDHVIIDGCNVSGCGKVGIVSYGAKAPNWSHSDITIQNCVVHDAGAGGIVIGSVNGGVDQFNITYRCGLTVDAHYGNWCYDCNAFITQFCESYQNQSSTVDGGGFDIDGGCTNCVVQYCYAHDNFGGGILCYSFAPSVASSGNVVRYNVLVNNATARTANEGGITIGTAGPAYSVSIYGNTIVQNVGACIRTTFAAANTVANIYNNILYATGTAKLVNTSGATSVAGITLRGNDYYATVSFSLTWSGTTYVTYAAWQAATSQEKISGVDVGLNVDPQLSNPAGTTAADFKPVGGSPVLVAGLDLQARFGINPGTRDYFGNPVATPFAMGACELAA